MTEAADESPPAPKAEKNTENKLSHREALLLELKQLEAGRAACLAKLTRRISTDSPKPKRLKRYDRAVRILRSEVERCDAEWGVWINRGLMTVLLLASVLVIALTVFRATSVLVEIEGSTEFLRFTPARAASQAGGAAPRFELNLRPLRVTGVSLRHVLADPNDPGAALLMRAVRDREAADQPEWIELDEKQPLDLILEAGSVSAKQGSEGVLAVSELSIPRGCPVAVSISENELTFKVFAPRFEANRNAEVRFTLTGSPDMLAHRLRASVGAAGSERPDGMTASFRATPQPDRPFSCTMRLNLEAMNDLTPLLTSDESTRDLRLHQDGLNVNDKITSRLLSATVRYPGLEVEPEWFTYHEMLRVRPQASGDDDTRFRSLLIANRVASEGSDRASAYVPIGNTAIAFQWVGTVEEATAGRDGQLRTLMPKKIFTWLGSKSQVYLLGVILYGGVLAFSLLRRSAPGAIDFLPMA